jgi:hypothetical protein
MLKKLFYDFKKAAFTASFILAAKVRVYNILCEEVIKIKKDFYRLLLILCASTVLTTRLYVLFSIYCWCR